MDPEPRKPSRLDSLNGHRPQAQPRVRIRDDYFFNGESVLVDGVHPITGARVELVIETVERRAD